MNTSMNAANMYRTILSEDVLYPILRSDLTNGRHEAVKAPAIKARRLSRKEKLAEAAWDAYLTRRMNRQLTLLNVA